MPLDQRLVDAAIEQLRARFPDADGIAAAMYTDDGAIVTGVAFQPEWGGGGLCAEAGPLCEAHRHRRRITATVCVARLGPDAPIVILTPCGICQERLFHWGDAVEVAVPDPADPTRWRARRLRDIQPYYWVDAYRRVSGEA